MSLVGKPLSYIIAFIVSIIGIVMGILSLIGSIAAWAQWFVGWPWFMGVDSEFAALSAGVWGTLTLLGNIMVILFISVAQFAKSPHATLLAIIGASIAINVIAIIALLFYFGFIIVGQK